MKLKNETFSRGEFSKTEKIKDCLARHPEGSTPKSIARETGLNVNTVKSALRRMKEITMPLRGVYKVSNGGDGYPISDGTLRAWNFHNLYLTFPVCYNTRDNFILDYELITIRVDIVNYKACVCVSSDIPMPLSTLRLINDLLNEKLNTKLSMNDMIVSSIEFNKDFDGYKLEGVKCLTMHTLYSQYKLYEKQRGVRIEHKMKVPFPMSHIANMLQEQPAHVNMSARLNENTEKLNKLVAQSVYNTTQINKLLDVMRR